MLGLETPVTDIRSNKGSIARGVGDRFTLDSTRIIRLVQILGYLYGKELRCLNTWYFYLWQTSQKHIFIILTPLNPTFI